jgi:hypothetical protein
MELLMVVVVFLSMAKPHVLLDRVTGDEIEPDTGDRLGSASSVRDRDRV